MGMDAQKIKFMMSIQQEIDKLKVIHGADNPVIIQLIKQFHSLSQSEIIKSNSPNNNRDLVPIKIDTEAIRSHLSIRGNNSVDYTFITNKLVKQQLDKDNLRMENSRYEISEKTELERFYDFCANAFYQVEQLINYYYGVKYPEIETLLTHLESLQYTKKEGNVDLIKNCFKRNYKNPEKSIDEITIGSKLFAFRIEFFNVKNDYTGTNIDNLRLVRNEGQHRCEVIKNDIKENKPLFLFFKNNNFNSVKLLIEKVKDKVKENL